MTTPVAGDIGFSYEYALDVDRNWNTPNEGVPDWLSVVFITDLDPKNDKQMGDGSTYANKGGSSEIITGEGWTVDFNHQLQRSPITKEYVESLQIFVEAAKYGKRNKASKAHIRCYDALGADNAFEGVASVSVARGEKGAKGIGGYAISLTGDGPATPIINPVAAGAPTTPVVAGVSPSGQAAGTAVVIKGAFFTGATAVKFGATAATSFSVIDINTIVAVLPAGSAGSAAVTVTTPSGVSAAFPYTRGA